MRIHPSGHQPKVGRRPDPPGAIRTQLEELYDRNMTHTAPKEWINERMTSPPTSLPRTPSRSIVNRTILTIVAIICLTCGFLIGHAWSHDWYPSDCCHGQENGGDCRPVPCEQIKDTPGGGAVWNGVSFEKTQVYASPNGKCHVCEDSGHGYCAFTVQGF